MTAEIAILNKEAIALAADSAVTISLGSKEEKIFDSADKLFELSNSNPIGIMIYNGMSFMETPLPSLIRQFRSSCAGVETVPAAAEAFLAFLSKFGRTAPREVKDRAILNIVGPVISRIMKAFTSKLEKMFAEQTVPPDKISEAIAKLLSDTIDDFLKVFSKAGDANFVDGWDYEITKQREKQLVDLVNGHLPQPATEDDRRKALEIAKLALRKNLLSPGATGIVVAGFGSKELFPTLVSYEIDGMVCDRLKYVQTNHVDIGRVGPKASVIPFAQKEMVERFLYGLDGQIQREVSAFCVNNVSNIRTGIFEQLEFEDDDERTSLEKDAREAERVFAKRLEEDAFQKIRSTSKKEIEDMVEFMPKPELAKMAKALVNLTSIKRRVSRGVETVGGPIDVAVISQSEGFVWIERKHYFPTELNPRYMSRVRDGIGQERRNGQTQRTRRARAPRGGPPPQAAGEGDVVQRTPAGGGGNGGGDPQGFRLSPRQDTHAPRERETDQ